MIVSTAAAKRIRTLAKHETNGEHERTRTPFRNQNGLAVVWKRIAFSSYSFARWHKYDNSKSLLFYVSALYGFPENQLDSSVSSSIFFAGPFPRESTVGSAVFTNGKHTSWCVRVRARERFIGLVMRVQYKYCISRLAPVNFEVKYWRRVITLLKYYYQYLL